MMFRHGEFVVSHKPFYVAVIIGMIAIIGKLWPILLTWFNFNPSMDK